MEAPGVGDAGPRILKGASTPDGELYAGYMRLKHDPPADPSIGLNTARHAAMVAPLVDRPGVRSCHGREHGRCT